MPVNLELSNESAEYLKEFVKKALDSHTASVRYLEEIYDALTRGLTKPCDHSTSYHGPCPCTEVYGPLPVPHDTSGEPGRSSDLDLSGLQFTPPIDYSALEEKSFKSLRFYECPDEDTAVLKYAGCTYYVKISAVKRLPHPLPSGFLKGCKLSNARKTAIRLYCKYLSTLTEPEPEPEPEPPLVDPEDAYRPILKTNTRVPHEDFTKIEGTLEE